MAMNPVSFRGTTTRGGKEVVTLSMARLGISMAVNQPPAMHVIVTLCKGECMDDDEVPEVIGTVILDEALVINGLKLLFPHGELNVS